MPKASIICGMILTLLGVITFAFATQLGADHRSVTALIPAFIGFPMMLLGYFAVLKPDLRMHLMHAAVLIALLGFIASAGRWVMHPGFALAGASIFTMAILTGIFVILCVRSFIAARRARQAGNP